MRLLGPHCVPHSGRTWAGSGARMPLAAESGRAGMDSAHGHSAVMRSTTTRRRQVCLELRLASRHHPGGQQGDAGGGVRSDPYCGVWVAALAPTVAHARVSAPHRLVTRPFFHGLAPRQHTRLRALDLATPAVAVDAQQVRQRSARALVQHGARVPDHAWMACGGSLSRPRGASGVLAKLLGGACSYCGSSEHVWVGWYYVHAEG